MDKRCFVFAVCGNDDYLKDLNYAIHKLKKYTQSDILVITDSSRNKNSIPWENTIDVKTPEQFDHHQASIFLKTSVFRYTQNYDICCYLDTDVLCCSNEADSIFQQPRTNGIAFASDHLPMNYFSPYAINCGCLETNLQNRTILLQLIQKYNPYFSEESLETNFNARDFYRKRKVLRNQKISALKFLFNQFIHNLILSHFGKKMTFSGYQYDGKKRIWTDENGNVVLYHAKNYSKEIEADAGFHFNQWKSEWKDKEGKTMSAPKCLHLHQEIEKKLNGKMIPELWQQPNGGVFVYDKTSESFLNRWHNNTLEYFSNKLFRTRDQSSLTLTIWETGMEHAPLMDNKFNVICDFYNYNIFFDHGKVLNVDGQSIQPVFAHLLKGMWKDGWDIWEGLK